MSLIMDLYKCPRCSVELYYIKFLENNKLKCTECGQIGSHDDFFQKTVNEEWLSTISKTDEERRLLFLFGKLTNRERLLLFQWIELVINKQQGRLS